MQAYAGAISRAVARKKAEDGEAHVLDVGSGSGLLAVLAAKAGASSVVTCELHEGLAAAARRVSSASMILSENPRKHLQNPADFAVTCDSHRALSAAARQVRRQGPPPDA